MRTYSCLRDIRSIRKSEDELRRIMDNRSHVLPELWDDQRWV